MKKAGTTGTPGCPRASSAPSWRTPSTLSEEVVTNEGAILGAYEWTVGDCFRCAQRETPTTRVGEIETPIGDVYEIRACKTCVLCMEAGRRRDAERHGWQYRPGCLGMA